MPRLLRFLIALSVLTSISPVISAPVASRPQAVAVPTSARSWLDRRQVLEEYLKSAEVVKMEKIGRGVTNPMRAYLAPGGPADRMTWKAVKPGRYHGFWESYKSEIAAYELDKFLQLDMIPPTVERRLNGDLGAAVMWLSGTKSFRDLGGPPTAPPASQYAWNRQLIQAKMFDNLIGNIDPNLGNWLVDGSWQLALIDHTRAFTESGKMVHKLTRIDRPLWNRMKALTVESLSPVLEPWLDNQAIRAILARRDRMQGDIEKLVASKSEAAVFVQ